MDRNLKYGLIIGGIQLLLILIFYFISKPIVASGSFFLFNTALMVLIMIIGMYRQRSRMHVPLDYGERFKFCFLSGIISFIPNYFIQLLLFKLDSKYQELTYIKQAEMSGGLASFINKFAQDLDKYQIEEQKVDQMIMLGDIEQFDPYSGALIVATVFNAFIIYMFYALIIPLFIGSEKLSLKERWERIDF